jgi:hypothetical protein
MDNEWELQNGMQRSHLGLRSSPLVFLWQGLQERIETTTSENLLTGMMAVGCMCSLGYSANSRLNARKGGLCMCFSTPFEDTTSSQPHANEWVG